MIIPCKDAAGTLGEQLDALATQSLASGDFEVLWSMAARAMTQPLSSRRGPITSMSDW